MFLYLPMATKQTSKESSDKTPTKADFIRGLAGVPAKEVVAKAQEAGITLSEDYVYKLRSSERIAAKKAAGGEKPASPKKAAPKKRGPKKGSKKGASSKAAAATKSAEQPASAATHAPRRGAASAGEGERTALEAKFIDLVLDLGLNKAEDLFAKLRQQIRRAVLA